MCKVYTNFRRRQNSRPGCQVGIRYAPSFIVNPERQSWRCFGACSTGGDAFSFIMRMENVEFGEALRILAQKTGVTLSQTRRSEDNKSEALYRVNQVAARFFQDVLESSHGEQATTYLNKRGVNAEARDKFALGLSPHGWEGLKTHLLALGVSEDEAAVAVVVVSQGSGRATFTTRRRYVS